MDVDLSIRTICPLQRFFRRASQRGCSIKHTYNRRPLCPAEVRGSAENVICGDSTLAIGRTGQGNLSCVAGNEVSRLDHVADRVNVGITCLKMSVDANSAARARLQASVDRELAFGPNADSDDHDLRS